MFPQRYSGELTWRHACVVIANPRKFYLRLSDHAASARWGRTFLNLACAALHTVEFEISVTQNTKRI
jgi:hypothetical protein